MRKVWVLLAVVGVLYSCGSGKFLVTIDTVPIIASLDLVNIKNDKVAVSIDPGAFTSDVVSFRIPKTVPGTYSSDDYGTYIQDLVALDYNGKLMEVVKEDVNTWRIANAKSLDKITYWVNDTYDTEKDMEDPVFSPAGTNILEGENFLLNLHGFVGYFDGYKEIPYSILVQKPVGLVAATTLAQEPDRKPDAGWDGFVANRYFEVIDNPILYARENIEVFKINDIEVTLSVYSPNGVYRASDLKERMQEMMMAQKTFLGEVDSTKEYAILLYLSELDKADAQGFGALEHHTSTVVVLPESMSKERLEQAMVDVVSHEFFHIVTPLSIHSKEIQFFDFNDPKMSKHLWMYEGTTEYFANLFQIQQGLIDEAAFYERIMDKVANARTYEEDMSFTVMSQNILEPPYDDNFGNVYEKGTLINMSLDILIREKSGGEKGVLWLMKELSKKYGKDIPFEDDMLIPEIVAMTYPEVGLFFETHVIGKVPIDYSVYLAKVGLAIVKVKEQTGYFLDGEIPFIDVDQENGNTIFVRENIGLNTFFTGLGVQNGDVIQRINGTDISLESIRPIIAASFNWTPDTKISMDVLRNGKLVSLSGVVGTPELEVDRIISVDGVSDDFYALRNAWLKQ
ncbi:peptidase M61 [Maribacter chungangensis]|uniref:Peptidase M61 n=1 Tax=Maribacter chungangensis TaxID=1069117 RepID=A0ABW3B1B7_9FLAO